MRSDLPQMTIILYHSLYHPLPFPSTIPSVDGRNPAVKWMREKGACY